MQRAEWPFSGQIKLELVRRLHDSWEDVADLLGVPVYDRARFRNGREPTDLWAWLEVRHRLTELPGALHAADRDDILAPVFGALSTWNVRPGRVGPRQVGMVPSPADCFQQRRVADELHTRLTRAGASVILTGLGGVGKTQLAAGAVRRLVENGDLDDIVWLKATSADRIAGGLARAGVDLAGADGGDPEAAAERLLTWLATTERRWLVVVDDLCDPPHLDGWWPPRTATGRVLVTTRRRDAALGGHGHVMSVGPFDVEEATAYLSQKFAADPRRLSEVGDLAADLGHLPVALAQAAAYIDDRDLTCADFRRRLARHQLGRLAPDAWPDQYARSVAAAIALGIEAADRLEPPGLAGPLLSLLSLLDPHDIPTEIVEAEPTRAYLSERAGQPVDVDLANDALTCLLRLSLVVRTVEPAGRPGLAVHALVQRVGRELTLDGAAAAIATANGLTRLWPTVDYDSTFLQRLRANAIALRTHAEWALRAGEHWSLLFFLGRSYGQAGQVAEAVRYFDELVAEAEARFGPGHRTTLAARFESGRWRGVSGDPAAAIAILTAVYEAQVAALGERDIDAFVTRRELARRRGDAGDAAGAVAALTELLADQFAALGPDDIDTMATRHQWAFWTGRSGDPTSAVRACEELLSDRLRILGPDHPDTLEARSNVARWRGTSGDPAGALATTNEVLADRVRVLGPNHPRTLSARYAVALWCGRDGDPAGAVALFESVLVDQLRILGPDHPHTLKTRHQLAEWLAQSGDVAAAVARLELVLADQVRVLGPDHPRTVLTRGDLERWDAASRYA